MAKRDYHGISDLSKAVAHRRSDAGALQRERRWRGAIYMAGYAIECLLKVSLMRKYGCRTLEALDEELESRGVASASVYTHQLLTLLTLAGVVQRMRADRKLWDTFRVVNRWTPAWRYSPDQSSEEDAIDFLSAVDEVMTWVRNNV